MYSRALLKDRAKDQLSWRRGMALAVVFTVLLIGFIPTIISLILPEAELVSAIVSIIVNIFTIIISGGIARFYLNFATEDSPSYGDLFSQAGLFLKILGITALMTLLFMLGLILLVIPGIIMIYMYSMSIYVLIDDPSKGVIECLRESRYMMKGHKWQFFVLNLSFILWGLLCVVTCGIAYLWVAPYIGITEANYYLYVSGQLSFDEPSINMGNSETEYVDAETVA